MPYLKVVKPMCRCALPKTEDRKTLHIAEGTVWECLACKTQYTLVRNGNGLAWEKRPVDQYLHK